MLSTHDTKRSVDVRVRIQLLSEGEVEKGFSTPAKLLGPDFILGFEAVRRRDDPVA